MSQDYLQFVNEIIRKTSVFLNTSIGNIDEVTNQIFSKIAEITPPQLRVVTFAILRLRDITDPNSWGAYLFPNAPVRFFNCSSADEQHYAQHITKLQWDFKTTNIVPGNPTVVGTLCEGGVGIDILEVVVSSKNEITQISDGHIKASIKNNFDGGYLEVYNRLYSEFTENKKGQDITVFVTMLSELLKKWDVTVVTANNIRRDSNIKSGLCGVVLCFERTDGSSTDNPFVQNLPVIFAPILQLLTSASLLECVSHFHDQSQKLVGILANKVRPTLEMLETIRWEIREAIGGCFGEDLAMLREDLLLKRKDADSLSNLFSLSESEKTTVSERGMWHLSFDKERINKFKNWLDKILPMRYPHLFDNPDFKCHFINRILAIQDKENWEKLFSCGGSYDNPSRLEHLFLMGSLGKCIFKLHVDAMHDALMQNFGNVLPNIKDDRIEFVVDNVTIRNDHAISYLNLARTIDTSAQFARIRHHPQSWIRLYKGKVSIIWKCPNRVLAETNFDDIKKIPETLEWRNGEATMILTTYSL